MTAMINLRAMLKNSSLPRPVAVGILCALLAVLAGALLGFAGPLITIIVLFALVGGIWALADMEVGLWAVIAVIALLPFGTMPFKVVLTPTLLDVAMGAVLVVYAMQWMSGRRFRLTVTPAHAPIVAFMVMAIFAFIAGLRNGPLTSNLARHFAEFLLSIGFTFVIVDYVQDAKALRRMAAVMLLCGAAAAFIGIALYFMPDFLAERLLSSLRVIGYPSGGVLQYIESNPELGQRAIGTSVNPNAFGGLLAIVGALCAPQLGARQPIGGKRWVWVGVFALLVVCLFLTFSRTAMVSLLVAVLVVAAIKYRSLVWVLLVGAAIVFVLPVTQDYILRFAEGLRGEDLATQMRFGEYKDALILLSRYPVIGVGFASAPDIDIYLGVSNAYLAIAQQMGFVGLTLLLLALAVVFGWAFDHRRAALSDETLEPMYLGFHAALVAALIVGIGDHYFVNLDFQPAQSLFWTVVGLGLSATRLSGARKMSVV